MAGYIIYIYINNIFFFYIKKKEKREKRVGISIEDKHVTAPAKTGRDSNSNTAVITTAQPNNANFVHKKNKHLSHKTLLRLKYYDTSTISL